MKIRIITFLLSIIIACPLVAQKKTIRERLRLSVEFAQTLQKGSLSNESIMKKYVAEGYYFKDDSVKKMADEYLNSLRTLKDRQFSADRYEGHEDEFAVIGVRALGDTSTTPHKLRFTLSKSGPNHTVVEQNVNEGDLYILRIIGKERNGKTLILFDHNNKILSFAGMIIGDGAGLMQF